MWCRARFVGVCLSFFLGLGFCWGLKACANAVPKQSQRVEKAVSVEVTKVIRKDIPQNVQAIGSLDAVQRVTLSAEDSGRVTAINFKNGQEVVKGMPIAMLSDAKAKAEYQSAVTALKVAETTYNRSKLLLNEAISQQQLDQLAANKEAAKAAVQKAQAVLDDKQVDAPFNGLLGTVKVQVGDYVNTGDPVVEIVSTQQLRVDYTIPQNSIPSLKVGQLVEVTSDAYPDKKFYGTVNYISPIVNADTRSVSVQAMISNKKGLLSPGMYVHVQEQTMVIKGTLTLPQEAVQVDIKGYYVFLVKNNHAVQTYVKIGDRKDDWVQIKSGLKAGDMAVTAGLQKVNDGSLIRIVKQ